MNKETESGRTLLELVMTLAVIGVLGMGAIKFYKHTVNKVKAQNTAKMIKTIAFERQNMALRQESNLETTVKGPHSSLYVKNGTSGNHQSYFWVETTLSDKDFCESLKESGFIQAEFVEVDGVTDGNCTDQSKLAFYFKKNPNANVYCPSHSTNCDTYGDATGCEDGYYLSAGVCESCPEHVATCENENTPTSCEEGYHLYGSICSDLPSCTVDSDCDLCGTCAQDGYCSNICVIPEPDQNNSCGDNECIVYDDTTQTCQNKCERKEYLESTGMQYIDSWIRISGKTSIELKWYVTHNSSNLALYGSSNGSSYSTGERACFYGHPHAQDIQFVVPQGNASSTVSPTISDAFKLDTTLIIKDYPDKCVINDVEFSRIKAYEDYTSDRTLQIFCTNRGGGNYRSIGRLYYFKIKDDGTLVRDFIPVLSPSGQPAMFDRVTQKLFYNAGTGEFLTD